MARSIEPQLHPGAMKGTIYEVSRIFERIHDNVAATVQHFFPVFPAAMIHTVSKIPPVCLIGNCRELRQTIINGLGTISANRRMADGNFQLPETFEHSLYH